MNFSLTREQKMVHDLVHNFAVNEVKPIAADVDDKEYFPRETVTKMARYHMLGIPFPKEYGGAGGDYLSYIIAVEGLSKVCGTTGVILSAHTSLGASPIYYYGTEEQKQKYLVPLAQGKKLGAFGLTEPNAGTDAGSQETTAELVGDNYILNGTKVFITNGGEADIYVVFAMTDKAKGTRGISAFIVEKDFPGFYIGKLEHKMGIRGSATSELIFENCIVPKENLLGHENNGFSIALQTLDGGRIGIAAQALGLAQGALDEAVQYMKERTQFKKPLAAFQGLQWMIADMETQINAARLLVYHAAETKESGTKNYSKESAMAKLFAAETAMDVTTKCVQLFGGYGYSREYPLERMMRDAKITEIYEGT
ncbi:acyl-CoA dehydrogenase, partial [Clostridia bacterium OttesenSCG-928-F22]|nr:acyl-CoA dehydrogenase [Clostridia bacterium OttesenSCG-928-F22]